VQQHHAAANMAASMKISELFAAQHPLFSFEFFPPKTDEGAARLAQTISELAPLEPAYVSVTYGAGGSTRDRTLDLVTRIPRESGLTAMAHLTCVGSTQAELKQTVDALVAGGVENIIALRGDPPKGASRFESVSGGFSYASELVGFLRESYGSKLCIAAAAYPEGHIESADIQQDIDNLKRKVDAGVDVLVTQLFFDNTLYYRFVERARAAGISVPIVAGIMPITNVGQIERFTKMCGSSIPAPLHQALNVVRDDATAVLSLGVEHAQKQCADLIAQGVPGIHFYTLNKSTATRDILTAVKPSVAG